jgi:hypothetical protein
MAAEELLRNDYDLNLHRVYNPAAPVNPTDIVRLQDLTGYAASNLAKYIVQQPHASLPNAQALSALATGLVKNTTTTGVLSIATGGTDFEFPLTFSQGVTRNVNAVTGDYITGKAGSQVWVGSNNALNLTIKANTAATGTLNLTATTTITSGALQVNGTIQGNADGANSIILLEGGGNQIFRGLVFPAWVDSASSTWFQVGGTSAKVVLSALNASAFGRLMFIAAGAQITAGAYNTTPVPTGIFEVLNASQVVQLAVGTSDVTISSLGGSGSAIVKASSVGLLSRATGGTDYEVPLTFSQGVTRTVNAVTGDYITGKAGSQTWVGSNNALDLTIKANTAGSGNLTLTATGVLLSNAQTLAATPTLTFDNSAATGQAVIHFMTSATLRAGFRATYAGDNLMFSKGGGLYFLTGGDFGSGGTQQFLIDTSGNLTVTTLAGTGSAIVKASAAGLLSRATAGTDFESPLTFTSGVTRSVNTVTGDYITGKAGSQTWVGSNNALDLNIKANTAGTGTLTLTATTTATSSKLQVAGSIRGDAQDGNNSLLLLDGLDRTVFRGIQYPAWTDAASAMWFQVGASAGKTMFTTQNANPFARLAFLVTTMQVSAGAYDTVPVPTGIFDVLNASQVSRFRVDTNAVVVGTAAAIDASGKTLVVGTATYDGAIGGTIQGVSAAAGVSAGFSDNTNSTLNIGHIAGGIAAIYGLAGSAVHLGSNNVKNRLQINTSGNVTITDLAGGSAALVKASTAGLLSRATSGTDYEVPLTFASGVTRASNTVTGDYITGKAGSQVWQGSNNGGDLQINANTAASGSMVLVVGASVAQRNGAAAQRFEVHNTWTSSTNYERAVMEWTTTANILTIGAQKGSGGGTLRKVDFVGDGFGFNIDPDSASTSHYLYFNNSGTRDKAQFAVGGGPIIDTNADRVYFNVAPNGTSVNSGVAGTLWATVYFRSQSFTGLSGSPTITTMATLVVDAPTFSGVTMTNYYAISVPGGMCKFDNSGSPIWELRSDPTTTDPVISAGRIPIKITTVGTKYLHYYNA